MERLHPTKRLLLETVIKLLDTKKPEEILSDEVLQISGISKGSMYYHYKDWYEIIEDAICERFGSKTVFKVNFLGINFLWN